MEISWASLSGHKKAMDVDHKKNLILEDSQDYKYDLRKDDSDERLAKLGESA